MAFDHCSSEECVRPKLGKPEIKRSLSVKVIISQSLQKSVHLIFLLVGIAHIIQIYTVCGYALFWIAKED